MATTARKSNCTSGAGADLGTLDLEIATDPLCATTHPAMWSIRYDQLQDVRKKVEEMFSLEESKTKTMRDVNEAIIKPTCRRTGTSYALSQNPCGLLIDAFITHCWDEPFLDFVDSIQQAFQFDVTKPTLWICSFALNQEDLQEPKSLLSADFPISESPFVQALQHASVFVVARNSVTDLYSRSWCVCELLYAVQFSLLPQATAHALQAQISFPRKHRLPRCQS